MLHPCAKARAGVGMDPGPTTFEISLYAANSRLSDIVEVDMLTAADYEGATSERSVKMRWCFNWEPLASDLWG